MLPTALAGRAVLGLGLAECQTAAEPRAIELRLHGAGADQVPTRTAIGCETDTDEPGRRSYLDATGVPLARATITGTADLALALVAPSTLPSAARALVACVRLTATTSSPAK